MCITYVTLYHCHMCITQETKISLVHVHYSSIPIPLACALLTYSYFTSKCALLKYPNNTGMCITHFSLFPWHICITGAQWLSGRVLDSRPKGRGFEPHRRHCIVSLSKNINPSLVLVQPRKTRPFITERLLMGHKESNKQTNIT